MKPPNDFDEKVRQRVFELTGQNPTSLRLKIITAFVNPPIPDRRFDWSAHYDGHEEGGDAMCWGRTEAEAIADLMELKE